MKIKLHSAFELLLGFFVVAAVIVLGIAANAHAAVHTLQFVETPAVSLYASESYNATTMTVTPVPADLDGSVLTMAGFGSSPTVTVDPGITGSEEIESFTGITNNGNNTATLTGLTRDLNSQYPYALGPTGISHGAGAIVVFSNNPQLYNRLASWENDGFVTGSWVYETQPTYLVPQTFANPLALVDQAYVNAFVANGAATSTFANMGIVQLATPAQVSAGTASSTAGAPLVIPAKEANSTYNALTVFAGMLTPLRGSFDIDPNFIATSSANIYNWGAVFNLAKTAIFTTAASSTFNATTTIAASSTVSNALRLNGINYAFPQNLGASSTVLSTDSNGKLIWVVASTTYSFITAVGQPPNSSTSFFTVTATCNAGQTVVGGGGVDSFFGGSTSITFGAILSSYPSASNAWTTVYSCINGGNGVCSGVDTGFGTTTAICVNP